MSPEFIYQILIGLFASGAVYGGIRADLKGMHSKIEVAKESGDKANARLDNHLEKHNAHV